MSGSGASMRHYARLSGSTAIGDDKNHHRIAFLACRFLPTYASVTQNNHQQAGNPMIEQSDEILTIEEVATYLKAGRRTVYRLAANGQIPAFKLGGVWRFRRAELERWIAARIGEQDEKPKPDEGRQ